MIGSSVATDEELLVSWAEGDKRSGDALVRKLFPAIRRFFASKVGTEVEELVQQTFARLLEARTRFAGRSSVRAYVYGIARNVLFEHYRKRMGKADVEEQSVQDMAAGASTLRWRRKEDELLLESLRSLPLHMQIVLELYYWDDFSIREIAEILEVPEGTVASRIRRAKLRLRECFEGTPPLGADEDSGDANLDAWSDRIRGSVPLESPDPTKHADF